MDSINFLNVEIAVDLLMAAVDLLIRIDWELIEKIAKTIH